MQKEVRDHEETMRRLFFNLYSQIKTPEAELKAKDYQRALRPTRRSVKNTPLALPTLRTSPSPPRPTRRTLSSVGKTKLHDSLHQLEHKIKRIAAGQNDSSTIDLSLRRGYYSPSPELLSPLPTCSYITGKLEETFILPTINEVRLVEKPHDSEANKVLSKFDAANNKMKQFAAHFNSVSIYAKGSPGKVWRPDLGKLGRSRRNGIILDKAVEFHRDTTDTITSRSPSPPSPMKSCMVEPMIKSSVKPKNTSPKSFTEVVSEQDSHLELLLSRVDLDRSKRRNEKLKLLKKPLGYGASEDLAAFRRLHEKRRKIRLIENSRQQQIYSRAVYNLRYVAHELSPSIVTLLNSFKAFLEAGEVLSDPEVALMLEVIGQPQDEESQKTARGLLRQFELSEGLIK
jgi:hypothetical protein